MPWSCLPWGVQGLALLAVLGPVGAGGILIPRTGPTQMSAIDTLACKHAGSTQARLARSRVLRLRGGSATVESAQDDCAGASNWDAAPCIGALQDYGPLERFYESGESNAVFRRKLLDVKGQYPTGYRAVKGDGNCFIRGYVFGLLEDLLSKPAAEASGFRGVLMAYFFSITDNTNGLGYSAAAVEDFYHDIMNQVGLIERGDMSREMLRDNFNTPTLSNAVIFFCRLVCSCYIQQHPELFAPFVGIYSDDPVVVAKELRSFCLREVEPLEREVEQVQVKSATSRQILRVSVYVCLRARLVVCITVGKKMGGRETDTVTDTNTAMGTAFVCASMCVWRLTRATHLQPWIPAAGGDSDDVCAGHCSQLCTASGGACGAFGPICRPPEPP